MLLARGDAPALALTKALELQRLLGDTPLEDPAPALDLHERRATAMSRARPLHQPQQAPKLGFTGEDGAEEQQIPGTSHHQELQIRQEQDQLKMGRFSLILFSK